MSQDRFGDLARGLASARTRRDALRVLGAAAAGGVLTMAGRSPAEAAGRCKRVGQQCRPGECCDGSSCNPATGRCQCFGGGNVCSRTRMCIYCGDNATFNPETCVCECNPGTTECSDGRCCPEGSECCGGGYYGSTCCPTGTCCPSGYCDYGYGC